MRGLNFGGLIGDSATRLVISLFSGVISIAFLMLILGIVSVDELGKMLNLSASQMEVIKSILAKIHVVIDHLLQVLSKLLTKLMSWAGVEVDLSKIKLDMDAAGTQPALDSAAEVDAVGDQGQEGTSDELDDSNQK